MLCVHLYGRCLIEYLVVSPGHLNQINPFLRLPFFSAIGVSFNCSSNIYCGSQPVSEPEAQAVTYFLGHQIEDFLCFLTIHSYGQLLLVPYGHPNFTASNYNELVFASTNTLMHVLHISENDHARLCIIPG